MEITALSSQSTIKEEKYSIGYSCMRNLESPYWRVGLDIKEQTQTLHTCPFHDAVIVILYFGTLAMENIFGLHHFGSIYYL